MTITVQQRAAPRKQGGWKWSVWLEGPDDELDQIESVQYQLHQSFPKPIHKIMDRSSKFRLDSSGWGEFTIYVTLSRKDGSTDTLQHRLRLKREAPLKETRPSRFKGEAPTVYLSSGLADSDLADRIAEALKRRGLKVLTQNDIAAGTVWQGSAHEIMEQSDAAAIVISDVTSPWVSEEIQKLKQQRTPIVPVIRETGGRPIIPEALQDLKGVVVHESSDLDAVADQIIHAVPTLTEMD